MWIIVYRGPAFRCGGNRHASSEADEHAVARGSDAAHGVCSSVRVERLRRLRLRVRGATMF